MVIIFFFMSKYQSETNDATKKKIMIVGALLVVGWFYVSAQMKPQRLGIEVHGSKVYDKDYFIEKEVLDVLNQYEFEIDDMNESQAGKVPSGEEKIDAWAEQQKRAETQRSQHV